LRSGKMEIAVIALLFTKRDVQVNAGHKLILN